MFSGETQEMNMYQAINHGLTLALENDSRTGECFVHTCFKILNRKYSLIHLNILESFFLQI